MPTPTDRHPRHAFRFAAFARLATFAAFAWGGTAFAQMGDPGIPSCPPPAWCDTDPRTASSRMIETADLVGKNLNRRRQTGDCSSLGPRNCLGLMIIQLMCAIDDRDWVQQYACLEVSGQALPMAAADDPETGAWLVAQIQDGRPALGRISLEDRATVELTVTDRFRADEGRVMVFVEAVDSIDRQTILMAIGTDGTLTYVADLAALYEHSR